MGADFGYTLAADAVLVVHTLFVAFVVLGLVVIYLGGLCSWRWVRNYWFRLLHLSAVAFVVLQSWAGAICPLTLWEMQLRQLGSSESYQGSFIQHWLQAILYFEAPQWVFVVVYTVFGGLVAASWFWVRPKT